MFTTVHLQNSFILYNGDSVPRNGNHGLTPAAITRLSVSGTWSTLRTSYKWSPTALPVWVGLAYFIQRQVLQVHPLRSLDQVSFLSKAR